MVLTKRQTRLDLPLVEKRGVEKRFVGVLQVVADSVDRGATCLDETGKFSVRHAPVVSCYRVDNSLEIFIVPDWFDVFVTGDFNRLFLLDRFADSLDQVRTTLEGLF